MTSTNRTRLSIGAAHLALTARQFHRGLLAILLTGLAGVLAGGLVLADVLHLKDGREIEGTIIAKNAKTLKISTRYGELEFDRSEIERIVEGKTRDELFDDKWKAAGTAAEFFELGEWARKVKLRGKSKKAMRRAVKLEPMHEGANLALGLVLYDGEWMKPKVRDVRMKADGEARMRAQGLVRHEGRWVTPEEKERLDKGMVLVDGKWISFEEAQIAKGLAEHGGEWLPRHEALARDAGKAVEAAAEVVFAERLSPYAYVAGNVSGGRLEEIVALLDVGRNWFQDQYGLEVDVGFFGDHMVEFYVFDDRGRGFSNSVEHFKGRSQTLPDGWVSAAKSTYGFLFWDPVPVSSARAWKRTESDLHGHCYHHWGHLMLNTLGYDGRLLPAWYDEAVAAWVEFKSHQRNAVACRTRASVGSGTSAKKATFSFDPKDLREGRWRQVVREALDAGMIPSFDYLAQREYSDMDLMDVAVGMVVIEWIASNGPDALKKFHAVLRETAPPSPLRVIELARDRYAVYDRAFEESCGQKTWRAADRAWRVWFENN